MTDPAIPTPEQVRAMPVTSVKALVDALRDAGLTVRNGGSHLRVETADGRLLGGLPATPSHSRSLRNARSHLARRAGEVGAARRKTNPQERS